MKHLSKRTKIIPKNKPTSVRCSPLVSVILDKKFFVTHSKNSHDMISPFHQKISHKATHNSPLILLSTKKPSEAYAQKKLFSIATHPNQFPGMRSNISFETVKWAQFHPILRLSHSKNILSKSKAVTLQLNHIKRSLAPMDSISVVPSRGYYSQVPPPNLGSDGEDSFSKKTWAFQYSSAFSEEDSQPANKSILHALTRQPKNAAAALKLFQTIPSQERTAVDYGALFHILFRNRDRERVLELYQMFEADRTRPNFQLILTLLEGFLQTKDFEKASQVYQWAQPFLAEMSTQNSLEQKDVLRLLTTRIHLAVALQDEQHLKALWEESLSENLADKVTFTAFLQGFFKLKNKTAALAVWDHLKKTEGILNNIHFSTLLFGLRINCRYDCENLLKVFEEEVPLIQKPSVAVLNNLLSSVTEAGSPEHQKVMDLFSRYNLQMDKTSRYMIMRLYSQKSDFASCSEHLYLYFEAPSPEKGSLTPFHKYQVLSIIALLIQNLTTNEKKGSVGARTAWMLFVKELELAMGKEFHLSMDSLGKSLHVAIDHMIPKRDIPRKIAAAYGIRLGKKKNKADAHNKKGQITFGDLS